MKSDSWPASKKRIGTWIERALLSLTVLVLFYIGRRNYLLFHGLVEVSSVAVSWIIFTIAWNSKDFSQNDVLKFLGISYFFVGCFDLVHTFAYVEMNVFKGRDANLPTQLWIIARWMESLSLITAPIFFKRRIKPFIVFFGFAAIACLLLAAIFKWGIFPACFIEDVGLTPFKKISEYLISLILLAAAAIFYVNREQLDAKVLNLLMLSIAATACSKLAFTLYSSPFGLSNLIGHLLKTISIYLIYKALVETGLKAPYDLLFRDLKQREQTLKESEARWRSITESTPDNIFTLDKDLNIVFANRRTLNFSIEDLIGKPFYDLLPEGERDTILDEIGSVLKTGEPRRHSFEHVGRENKRYHFDAIAAPISTSSGKERLAVSARDISGRVNAEKERMKVEEKLRQAQKLEAMGTLAGGVAHDFNNILMSILGFTDLVLLSTPEDDPRREDLNRVLQAALRAQDIVKQILVFSSKSHRELRPLNLSEFVPNAMKLIRASIPTTTGIQENISSDSCPVMADSTQIHQVLMNLCSNAHHAMKGKGGIIEIHLDSVHLDENSAGKIPGLSKGEYARLSVCDNGSGIDDFHKDRIFEPYFTTKNVCEGSGLGLAVAHGIVANHKGAVTLDSKKGQGSKFTVYLPKVEFFADDAMAASSKIIGGNERILFVEDDSLVAAFGGKFLTRLGYKTTVFENSQEALEKFKKSPSAWDIVVTDQTMFGMTGDELAKNIFAVRPDLPVILCTGYSVSIDAEKAEALGIKALLFKPITGEALARAIRSALHPSTKQPKAE